MDIQLKRLPHQTASLKAIMSVFEEIEITKDNPEYQNPLIDLKDPTITRNIQNIWSGNIPRVPSIPRSMRTSVNDKPLGIDVRMETGTGKTYVYSRLMFEMNRLGFNKFIILVPSTPIKEGTKSFIEASYSRQHFADLYPQKEIELNVLNAQKPKKGRKMFPPAIADFARATRLEKNKIQALLMTDSMLLSKATMAKNDYDQTLLGTFTQPYETLRETKPIVIIDEPHRFRRENKAYKRILDELDPQFIFRFGATFPKLEKTKETDYNNLVYNLGPGESFNGNLVKGVASQTLENIDKDDQSYKLMKITLRPKECVIRNEVTRENQTLEINDDLSTLDSKLHGVKIEEIARNKEVNDHYAITLSNGLVLTEGDKLYSSVYTSSYQELMLKQAVENHFQQEKENFMRENRIKTLSLFFIDNIYSYRGKDGGYGPLRLTFQNILEEKLTSTIKELESTKNLEQRELEYLDFLKASKDDISLTNGGYFAEDNSKKDEDIQNEVNQILRDKNFLLSFRDNEGNWNTRRFIFSKWTLKEGWDNPNVFQIAKLRSSGSEISKLQEVGRGLRLPVDEYGNRISEEQFYLTYLIDFTETDFVEKLTNEINSDIQTLDNISELLSMVAAKRGEKEAELFIELLQQGFVTIDKEIIEETRQEFYEKYPEFYEGVRPDKIIDKNKNDRGNVDIRPENYEKIKYLWEKLNEKYYLKLGKISDEKLLKVVELILNDNVYLQQNVNVVERRTTITDDEYIGVEESIVNTHKVNEEIPYNEFLKRIHKETSINVRIVHQGLLNYFKDKKVPKYFFNKGTVNNFILKFKEWFITEYESHYTYEKIEVNRNETALTDYTGKLKPSIVQGTLGLYRADHVKTPEKFLYDTVVYDSPKEFETIQNSNSQRLTDKLIVFGKVPRRSIQVPLYFGGTTSPDFMYVLKDNEDGYRVGFIVETKDLENEQELRGKEKLKINSARNFFGKMKTEGLNIEFKPQLKQDDIINLIEGLFN